MFFFMNKIKVINSFKKLIKLKVEGIKNYLT